MQNLNQIGEMFSHNISLKDKKAFTLVELIIVVTILAILSTIAFVSFQNYTKDARDSNRLATLKNIENGLNAFQITTGNYPEPDTKILIQSSGTTLITQGNISINTTQLIRLNHIPLDPKDQTPFIYTTNDNKTKYSLLTLLENVNQLGYTQQSYAQDNTQRTPKVLGNTVGVLLDEKNNPVNENVIDLQLTHSGMIYKTVFSNNDIVSFSGYALSSMIYSRQGDAPKDCPEGFIPVPGNAEFNTRGGFCVAKYEMGYADGLTPNTCDGTCPAGENTSNQTDWNTVSYVPGKKVVSQTGLYPIAKIRQSEAIEACKDIGGHLITNNERMTIARNIESIAKNWSGSLLGLSNLYNGVSNNITLGCNMDGENIENRKAATRTGYGDDSICNIKRKHILSNGQEIWDFAGNVWEHVNKANTISGMNFNFGQTMITGSSSGTNWDDDGIYNLSDMRKYASAWGYNKLKGIGNLYHANGVIDNVFLRGGNADSASNDGIFSIILHRTSATATRYGGFRCSY